MANKLVLISSALCIVGSHAFLMPILGGTTQRQGFQVARAPTLAASPPAQAPNEVSVFDSEGAYSWMEFKRGEHDHDMHLSDQDLMYCFEYGECPVPDGMFTQKWNQLPYKAAAERSFTVFSGDDEHEETEDATAWCKTWHDDAGEADLAPEDYMNQPGAMDDFDI